MPMDFTHYLLIALMGPLTMFSEPIISIPHMLSLLASPEDGRRLFMLASVVTDHIFDAVEAFSIMFICYMVVYSAEHKRTFNTRNTLIFTLSTVAVASVFPGCMFLLGDAGGKLWHIWYS
jgi:hypothetical protein